MDEKEIEKLRTKEESVAKSRAELLRVNYMDARELPEESFFPDLMPIEDIDRYQVLPVTMDIQRIQFGFSMNTPQTSLDEVQKLYPQYRVFFVYLSQSGYDKLYQRYYEYAHKDDPKGPTPDELADQLANKILDVSDKIKESAEINLFDKSLDETQQAELFKFLAQQAYLLDSSDIHIEPEKEGARIRFRIDGRLHVVGNLSEDRYKLLLNDIQMRARIRWNADYPQSGSTRESLLNQDKENTDVNMRIETIPTIHGSDVVIRIFNLEEAYLNLDNLGLAEDQRDIIDEIIARPHGLVLMVGPTGSGKSSTLYAILNRLNTQEVKIITLEDPVEYAITGITQIPVKTDDQDAAEKNSTFMSKLRAVMREDPDIIMLGEIRDEESARTSLQASLTGHLVLSTFHANTAAAAVHRLLDLIGRNPLLASAIRLIMSQRLVRKLCTDCKGKYEPEGKVAEIVAQALQGIKNQPEEIVLYKPVGCDKCHHIGYRGRIVILEQLQISEAISTAIATDHDLTPQKLQEIAVSEGMRTMLQDGVLKAIAGETSIEEVFRVVDVR